MTKKLILTTVASVLTIGVVSGAVALNSTPQKTGADTSPITSTLQQQQDELNNHEARITNTESNVKAVADKTGTNTTTIVEVPAPVSTPSVATTPVVTPVTVTNFEKIVLDNNGNVDCKLTYSDGTTYQWHWKIINGGITNTNAFCSEVMLGTTK